MVSHLISGLTPAGFRTLKWRARQADLFKTNVLDLADSAMEISRERLVAAHKKYEDAAVALEQAEAAGRGVAEARELMQATRTEYLRVLRLFSDLALGKRRRTDEP